MSRREKPAATRGLKLFGPGSYDKEKPTLDFIPGWLTDNSVAMMYGPPGAAKTALALYMACNVSAGRAAFGNPTEQRRCLYLGLEGEAGVKARIQACCRQNRIDRSPIHYAIGAFNLADDEQRAGLIAYMKEHGIQVVFIDTLSRSMTGANENTAEEMSPIIDALHDIKAQTGACVVAITHTGKDVKAGIRGWSGQLGNVDTSIEVELQLEPGADPTPDTPRTARVRKQRDIEPGARFHFNLARHETDFQDARGNPVRSVAVNECEFFTDLDADTGKAVPKFSKREREALAVLARLSTHAHLTGGPTADDLRAALKRDQWGPDNSSSWRTAFERLIAKLPVRDGVLQCVH